VLTQPSIQYIPGHSRRVRRPERDAYYPPHLAQKLKKEQSYASTTPLGLRGLFRGELYFALNLGENFCSTAATWNFVTILIFAWREMTTTETSNEVTSRRLLPVPKD